MKYAGAMDRVMDQQHIRRIAMAEYHEMAQTTFSQYDLRGQNMDFSPDLTLQKYHDDHDIFHGI